MASVRGNSGTTYDLARALRMYEGDGPLADRAAELWRTIAPAEMDLARDFWRRYRQSEEVMEAIGDDKNYYLGLTYKDRTKKLAFHTVDMLTDLLDTDTLTIADSEVQVTVDEDSAKHLYYHLFKRPDGAQVLFVWNRIHSPTVTITLQTPGSSAVHYSLNGEATPYVPFDGSTLRDIQLRAGTVEIFRIDP